MCHWETDLEEFGKAGIEYCFQIGEVYFDKGRVQWTGYYDSRQEVEDEEFLIIGRGVKQIAKVDDDWDWVKNERVHSIGFELEFLTKPSQNGTEKTK